MPYRPTRLTRPFVRAIPPLFFPFTPQDAPGILLQLRGDQGVTMSGGKVTKWLDIIPNGVVASQATAGLQPVQSLGVNGQPSVSFNGGAALSLTAFAAAGSKTIVLVRKFNAWPAAGTIATTLSLLAAGGTSDTRVQHVGFPTNMIFMADGTAIGSQPAVTTLQDTIAHLDYIEFLGGTVTDPTRYNAYFDGVQKATSGGPFGAFSLTDLSSIGGRLLAGNTLLQGANVDIAECLVYGQVQTPAIRNKLGGYVQRRYGIIVVDATF